MTRPVRHRVSICPSTTSLECGHPTRPPFGSQALLEIAASASVRESDKGVAGLADHVTTLTENTPLSDMCHRDHLLQFALAENNATRYFSSTADVASFSSSSIQKRSSFCPASDLRWDAGCAF